MRAQAAVVVALLSGTASSPVGRPTPAPGDCQVDCPVELAHGALTEWWVARARGVEHPDFAGADGFTYRANAGTLTSAATAVTLTVTAVNDVPVAVVDSEETEGPLQVDVADGVLANDTDLEGDALTASVDTDPEHGTLVLAADGRFDYTPDAAFEGVDSFTYIASDADDSAPATVTIAVTVADTEPEPEDEGCGCATTPRPLSLLWLAPLVPLALRRRVDVVRGACAPSTCGQDQRPGLAVRGGNLRGDQGLPTV